MSQTFFLLLLSFLSLLTGCHKDTKRLAHTYFEQSMLEADNNNPQRALALIEKSLVLQRAPEALALKATLLYQMNHVSESLDAFKQALSLPNIPSHLQEDIRNNYACTLNAAGHTQQAQAIWKQLTRSPIYLTPEVAHYNLGLLALKEHAYTQAAEQLIQAVNIAPDYVDAHMYLSVVYTHQQQWDKARKELYTVQEYAPEFEVSLHQVLADIDRAAAASTS